MVDQNKAAGRFNASTYFPSPRELFRIDSLTGLNWAHHEDPFDDFNKQYLIPHKESTRGPKLAVADINRDGIDDIFLCGAKGQPGTLMLGQGDGKYQSIDTSLFAADKDFEDVDALFFDANGDGYPDLYVVSGGNEYGGNDPHLADRLYLNESSKRFIKAGSALPPVYANKSCVAAADFDHDGDLDLFVGTLADPLAYGKPQSSRLLKNDGKGNFSGWPVPALDHVGIVTAAVVTDLDKDGWMDLVIAGEWMPITILKNRAGSFAVETLPGSTGLWQTLFATDANGDGYVDILAGNWGWNTKFHSGKNGPLKMYVDDFDGNGKTEQLVSYTSNGIEYPFLAKDEVERSLPMLKKHYLLYDEYAGLPMKEVFYGWVDTVRPFLAERLGSAVCYGDGKGGLRIEDLPPALQRSPIFSFQSVGHGTYLAGGNFFDVIPYEGRYDAQALALFTSDHYIPQPLLSAVRGQVRDVKWLRRGSDSVLVVARNNEGLVGLKNATNNR